MSCYITQFGNNMQMVVEEFSMVLQKLVMLLLGVFNFMQDTQQKTFTSGSWLK